MPGPSAVRIELSADERGVLQGWARRRKTAQALALRSRIVLACADGATNAQVAAELEMSRDTVAKWRRRFARDRLGGLVDQPRPGRPRTVTDAQVDAVIAKTLEEQPPNQDSHWTSRSMAKASGLHGHAGNHPTQMATALEDEPDEEVDGDTAGSLRRDRSVAVLGQTQLPDSEPPGHTGRSTVVKLIEYDSWYLARVRNAAT